MVSRGVVREVIDVWTPSRGGGSLRSANVMLVSVLF